ncbi:MAG: Crp/Fnr family transcriptional regulator, partial [Pedobacter sp.]
MSIPTSPALQAITPLTAIQHLPHCSNETKQQFSQLFSPIEIEKGQLMITPNQLNTTVYLLSSGMVHQYRKVDGDIQTIRFYSPKSFLGQTGAYQNKLIPDYVSALIR